MQAGPYGSAGTRTPLPTSAVGVAHSDRCIGCGAPDVASASTLAATSLPTCTEKAAAVGKAVANTEATTVASASHIDLSRAPYVWYGVKYMDLVSPVPCQPIVTT